MASSDEVMESAVAEQLNLAQEYRVLTTAVGIIDYSSAGKLEVSGKNAIPFLNGLVTADLKVLSHAQGALAAFLNVHGKVLALARIYHRADKLLLDLDPSNREKIFQNLGRFVPAGEFQIQDLSDELALVSLQGPLASDLLGRLEVAEPDEAPYSTSSTVINETEVLIARHARLGSSGFDIFVSRKHVSYVTAVLLDAAISLGGRQVSGNAAEIVRIDSGIPVEPNEVNENHILLETGLESAVSYTKGCYLGQEIIARIHWRGQPARRVRRLEIEAATLPSLGSELIADDGKRVGELTSAAIVPADSGPRMVGLGYVHRYYLAQGTRFRLRSGETEVGFAEIRERQ